MKYAIVTKIGYTAGIYGCSGEYFLVVAFDGKHEPKSYVISGMYGEEERMRGALRDIGYKIHYTPEIYGRLTRKDIPSRAIESIGSVIFGITGKYNKK